jgi:aspartate-semialdehyde dehydrogenase
MSIHVPLVVPEVNGHVLKNFQGKVIAIPNCSTTPLALCLKPLHEKYGLHRVIVSTYQSVSGAGRQATEELSEQAAALLNGRSTEPQVFPHRIAFNCIPEIGETTESGYTEEEEKVSRELRKILDIPNLPVSATAVRVPTFCGHGLSVNVELCKGYDSLEEVRQLLDSMPGLKVKDKVEHHIYPTNVEATGTDQVLVGRIRRDRSVTYGLNLWIVVDNLRKGAALNALQCLETLYRYRRMI